MAIIAEKGYCNALMVALKQLAQENNPGTKITPVGFLQAAIENQPSIGIPEYEKLRLYNQQGNTKKVRVIYRPRITKAQTSTEDTCENDNIPVKNESEIDISVYRKYSFIIPTPELEKYCAESVAMVSAGAPPSELLREHIDHIMEAANGLYAGLNDDLINLVVFGNNAATGNNNIITININKDVNVLDLDSGFVQLQNQLRFNEVAGAPIIVGAGKMSAYDIAKKMMLGLGGNGANLANFNNYKYYYDLNSSDAWDAGNEDALGIFSPGTFGFVDMQKFIGFKAGKLGTSFFATLPLPMAGQNAPVVNFDIQIKFLDCPTEVMDGYGNLTTVNRAWQVIISKSGGLWQMPSDAYSAGDRLTGVNGAFLYELTNECNPCEA